MPPGENTLSLRQGDLLILTRDLEPGRPATYDSAGQILTPAVIGCTIPEVFDDVRAGESIWFDDGKIGGVVEKVENTRILVRITQEHLKAVKLQADKGINLPDSNLRLAAMTAKDIEDLSFVSQHADVVELSFANSVQDVESLQHALASMGSRQPAIVLKIETRCGFEDLPDMLLTAMRAPCCGVMIARGDLAVECGFERMAEVQEEILWAYARPRMSPCDLGHAGSGNACPRGDTVAGRDHGRGDGGPRRVRYAQQRALRGQRGTGSRTISCGGCRRTKPRRGPRCGSSAPGALCRRSNQSLQPTGTA